MVRGRDNALTLTIHKQVKIFEHRDTNEHLLAKYHGIADNRASKYVNLNPFSGVYFFYPSVSIFCGSVSQAYDPKLVCNKRRHGKARRPGINERFSGIGTHVLSGKMP